MDDLFLALFLLSLFYLVLGLVAPGLVLVDRRGVVLRNGFTGMIVFFVAFGLATDASAGASETADIPANPVPDTSVTLLAGNPDSIGRVPGEAPSRAPRPAKTKTRRHITRFPDGGFCVNEQPSGDFYCSDAAGQDQAWSGPEGGGSYDHGRSRGAPRP